MSERFVAKRRVALSTSFSARVPILILLFGSGGRVIIYGLCGAREKEAIDYVACRDSKDNNEASSAVDRSSISLSLLYLPPEFHSHSRRPLTRARFSRNRFLHPRSATNVLAVRSYLPFGQGAAAYAVRFHIEAHCFSLNQLHGSAPVRCYLPYRERAVRVHVCARVCLPFCSASLRACVYVQMNSEIRDLNLVIGTFG